jgi:ribosomal protein S20
MPNKKSAIKHLKQTKKAMVRNLKLKREYKKFTKDVRLAIVAKDTGKLAEYSKKVQKVVDKAAQSHIIKQGNASRQKSRLMSSISATLSSPPKATK